MLTVSRLAVAVLLLLPLAARAADDPPQLMTAQGAVDKVEKDSLTIKPRGPGGKFLPSVALKLTGTTKVTALTVQTRAGKTVLVQTEVEVKALKPKQAIAVIYSTVNDEAVLLSAVAQ